MFLSYISNREKSSQRLLKNYWYVISIFYSKWSQKTKIESKAWKLYNRWHLWYAIGELDLPIFLQRTNFRGFVWFCLSICHSNCVVNRQNLSKSCQKQNQYYYFWSLEKLHTHWKLQMPSFFLVCRPTWLIVHSLSVLQCIIHKKKT